VKVNSPANPNLDRRIHHPGCSPSVSRPNCVDLDRHVEGYFLEKNVKKSGGKSGS